MLHAYDAFLPGWVLLQVVGNSMFVMQQSDEAQQHRQGDVLELTCNGMVSCAYSMVILGHSAHFTPASTVEFISSCVEM